MTDPIYYGIDLREDTTIFCYMPLQAKEPATVSTVVGSEAYQIPTAVARVRGSARWAFGEEARRLASTHQATEVPSIYQKALTGESVFLDGTEHRAVELLALFLARLFVLSGHAADDASTGMVVFCVPTLDEAAVAMLHEAGKLLNLERSRIRVMDRRESFYYFTFHQEPQVFLQDVMLFDYGADGLVSCRLHRNQRTSPQTVSIDRMKHLLAAGDVDAQFDAIAKERMSQVPVSGVYLTGDGFDGGWLKDSLNFLCHGRRVFAGKNLYAKGASFAARVLGAGRDWPFVYWGDEKLRRSVSLRVRDQDKVIPWRLLTAGESWYEASASCELILDDAGELTFYLQDALSASEYPQTIAFKDLPERPPRTTRVRVTVRPVSAVTISVRVEDLGFGELFVSSGKTWNAVLKPREVPGAEQKGGTPNA